MAKIDVDIDIEDYLDEVETYDLIDELGSRKLNIRNQNRIKQMLKGINLDGIDLANTIIDDIKMDIVISGISNKSIDDLKAFFK